MYSYKRNLACSIIMISENAAPMTLLQYNGSLAQLQEARVPGSSFPITVVICDASTISANVKSITKRDVLELVLNILTHCLVIKSLVWL